MGVLDYSERLFETAKVADRQEEREENRILLSDESIETAIQELDTDQKKLAAWINIYNSLTHLSLTENPKLLERRSYRSKHFRSRKFVILDKDFSLDLIEHGILRKRKYKYSLGYFNSPFYPSFIKDLQLEKMDARIHFALNCGAASCPIIRYYNWQKIDEQLDEASRSYISQDLVQNPEKNEITISTIFYWFKGDFGGNQGILQFLKNYDFLEANQFPKIRFHNYDWRIRLQDLTH